MKLYKARALNLRLAALMIFVFSGFAGAVNGAAGLPDFARLVEQNAATIVEIAAVQMVEESRRILSPQELDEYLRLLDPDVLQPELELEEDTPQLQERGAVGSGFIISADGYVVTNHHVVAGASDITVEFTDRRIYSAVVIGLDEPSDLALLKIDAFGLPFAKFGNSDQLKVGEWVLAIGSPFGLEFSAAAGIVSAKGRSVQGQSSYNYMSFIQTDVAINQGNSGGPLFNLEGEVVGINSQIVSSSGGSNGISFSIPSNIAMNVISQLREGGQVRRGLLGVVIKSVSYPLAVSFGMDRPRGAFVDDVQPGSPAAVAGLQVEDIVLEYDGRIIEDSADLPFFVGQNQPGTRSELLVFRKNETMRMTVTLGSSPTNQVVDVTPDALPGRINPLGFTVIELGRENRQPGVSGVLVTEVEDGPAREAGIQANDVITSLNHQPIESLEQFYAVTSELPDRGFVPIRIFREGRGTTFALELN